MKVTPFIPDFSLVNITSPTIILVLGWEAALSVNRMPTYSQCVHRVNQSQGETATQRTRQWAAYWASIWSLWHGQYCFKCLWPFANANSKGKNSEAPTEMKISTAACALESLTCRLYYGNKISIWLFIIIKFRRKEKREKNICPLKDSTHTDTRYMNAHTTVLRANNKGGWYSSTKPAVTLGVMSHGESGQ